MNGRTTLGKYRLNRILCTYIYNVSFEVTKPAKSTKNSNQRTGKTIPKHVELHYIINVHIIIVYTLLWPPV